MPINIGQKLESDFRNPIGILSDCHRRIEKFLSLLIEIAEHARGDELDGEQRQAFEVALRYFREAAPKHTLDEEESLFPRMRNHKCAGNSKVFAALDALHTDHRAADLRHKGVDELGRAWLSEHQLPPDDTRLLIDLLNRLREMYKKHIAIEDEEIFPLAATILDRADLKAIAREMALRRALVPATLGL